MAWVAVDKEGDEALYEQKPLRSIECWETKEQYDRWFPLPKGSVEKLTGKKITWEDEPVELKENMNKIKYENVNLAIKMGYIK